MENENIAKIKNNIIITKSQLMFPLIAMWVAFGINLILFFVYINKFSILELIFNIALNILFLVISILVTLSIKKKYYYFYFISIILSIFYGVINTIMEIINIVQLAKDDSTNDYIYSVSRCVTFLFLGWALTVMLFAYKTKVYIFCNASLEELEEN